MDAFLTGGRHRLPLIRATHFSPLESEFIGLSASLQLLRSAERRLRDALAAASGDPKLRLQNDLPRVSPARAIYEAVAILSDAVAPKNRERLSRTEAETCCAAALDEIRKLGRFGITESGYDRKELFEVRIGFARSRLEALP